MAPPFRPKRDHHPRYPVLAGYARGAAPGVLKLALAAAFVAPIAACGAAPYPDYPAAELGEDGVFTVHLESGDAAEVQVLFYADQVVLDELVGRMTDVESIVQTVLAAQRCEGWDTSVAADEIRSLVTAQLTTGPIDRVAIELVACGPASE